MPSQNVVPLTDVLTTGWTNTGTGGSFSSTLNANSGVGDGTHEVNLTSGTQGADGVLITSTGFYVPGVLSITSVSYTVHWEASTSKSPGDFLIEIWNAVQNTKLAHMASQIATTSTSEITSGPTNLTLDNGVLDWTSFRIKLFTAVGGSNVTGNFFGLIITPTYTVTPGGGDFAGVVGGSTALPGMV